MNDNPCYASCVNRSPARSPTREHCLPPQANDMGTPAFQIEEQLNEVYEKRLCEINEQANGDATLKEITYKEWITMLRQINKTLITNIQEMERETTERLNLLQKKVGTCRPGQGTELCKCRKDMAGLIQLVRNGRRSGDWSVDKFNFETITEHDIFGNDLSSRCPPPSKYESECSNQSSSADPKSTCAGQKSKLIANVKALAFEVADKHDEIRDLKKQILSMEDEIQKAQKKIQLKDDVIRELRNDLKALPKNLPFWGARILDKTAPSPYCGAMSELKATDSCGMDFPPASRGGVSYSNRESINSLNCNQMDSSFEINITEDEDEDEEFMKCLKEELNQLFDMRHSYDQNVDDQRRAIKEQHCRLCEMVDKLLKNNNEFQNKLRFYRHELSTLENPHSSRTLTHYSDGDSGICSDSDPDVKIVNTVRNRIGCLTDENHRLKREEQSLQIQYEDANCKELAKSELLERTSKALRQVVDALSNATSKSIAYDKIFGDCPNMTDNPIVDAVDELMDALKERDHTISELRRQIANVGKINQELECNSQKLRAEMCEHHQSMCAQSQTDSRNMLFQNQEFGKQLLKQAGKYQEENSATEQQDNHNEYLRIIDDLSTDLNTLSRQVNMVQSELPADEIAKQFESSLKGLETQNDLLQSAVESLIEERATIERTLQTKNEELKLRLCNQDEEICALESQLAQLQQRPCERCATRAQNESAQRDDRRSTPRPESNEELKQLEYELRRKAQTVECLKAENAMLNEQVVEIRRNQAKMKLLQRRGACGSPSATSGSNEPDLSTKLNAAHEKNREQCKSIQNAAKEIAGLHQEVEELRANEEIFTKERDLLQTELIALKESQATQLGTQQSLQEQLKGTICELYDAKQKLQESMQLKCRIESFLLDEKKRFQDLKADMYEKYNNLVEDYNNVLKEYQKVVQIEQEKTNQLRAFNAWKDEQIQIEKEVRNKMQMFENHIKEMLDDKQNLLDKLTEVECDNRSLLQVIDQSRACSTARRQQRTATSPSRGYTVMAANSSTDPVSKVIENVRSTSRRLSQQRCILEDEASRYFSK